MESRRWGKKGCPVDWGMAENTLYTAPSSHVLLCLCYLHTFKHFQSSSFSHTGVCFTFAIR